MKHIKIFDTFAANGSLENKCNAYIREVSDTQELIDYKFQMCRNGNRLEQSVMLVFEDKHEE